MKTCTKCAARLPLRFFPLINAAYQLFHQAGLSLCHPLRRRGRTRHFILDTNWGNHLAAADGKRVSSLLILYQLFPFRIVVRGLPSVHAKFIRKIDSEDEEVGQILAEMRDMTFVSSVNEVLTLINHTRGTYLDELRKVFAHLAQCPAVSNEHSQPVSDVILEGMNSVQDLFGTGHKGTACTAQCSREFCDVWPFDFPLRINRHFPIAASDEDSDLDRKLRNFVHQERHDNSFGSLAIRDGFLVLLQSNPLRLFGNVCCPFRRLIRKAGYDRGRDCGNCSDANRKPVGQISNFFRKRAELNCHKSSLNLECILP